MADDPHRTGPSAGGLGAHRRAARRAAGRAGTRRRAAPATGCRDDLVAFIRARLADDKAHAERLFKLGLVLGEKHQWPWSEQEDENNAILELGAFARRLLASAEAKRRIVAAHGPTRPAVMGGALDYPDAAKLCGTCGPGDDWQAEQHPYGQIPCHTVRLLASEWSTHPDYRAEWAP